MHDIDPLFDMDRLAYLSGLVSENARGIIVEGKKPLNEETDYIAYEPENYPGDKDLPADEQPHGYQTWSPDQDEILDDRALDMERRAANALAEHRLREGIRKEIKSYLQEACGGSHGMVPGRLSRSVPGQVAMGSSEFIDGATGAWGGEPIDPYTGTGYEEPEDAEEDYELNTVGYGAKGAGPQRPVRFPGGSKAPYTGPRSGPAGAHSRKPR